MPPFLHHFQRQVPFLGLKAEQRSLLEFVLESPHVAPRVRRKAHVLLLLDKGENFERITQATAVSKQAVRSLIAAHGRHGLRGALLGREVLAKRSEHRAAA